MFPHPRASALSFAFLALGASWAEAQQMCLPSATASLPIGLVPRNAAGNGATGDDEIVITTAGVGPSSEARVELIGPLEIELGERRLTADRATMFDRQRIEIPGLMTYADPEAVLFGEDATFDMLDRSIRVGAAGFELPARPARGAGEDIFISGSENAFSMRSVTFTTCPEGDRSWLLEADELRLDVEEGFGTARGVRIKVKGVTVLPVPYFTFPIDDRRKSGFLTPRIAERDRTGLDLSIPYYVNIAPNLDLTIEPRYMSQRGMQIGTELRYLTPGSEGQLDWRFLPDDNEIERPRRYVGFTHETELGQSLRVTAGIEQVSDDAYFEDLGSSLSATSQIFLDRYLDVAYSAPFWSLRSRFQNHQTLDATLDPVDQPYRRVPQLLFEGQWRKGLLGFDSTAELVHFDRNVGVTGWRFDTEQEVGLGLARPGMYLTPAIGIRQTSYRLDDGAGTPSRTLPVMSLDTGLRLERGDGSTSRWLQTLEPRMLYVHVPFEDQTDLPVFDTIVPDFNLVQLFRKYQFVGPDRVSDTDQLSLGVTTRLIEETTGIERLAATIGQTYYLSTQRVSLPGVAPIDANASDYVAELAIGLRDAWSLELGHQWNRDTERTARTETRFEYRPQDDRVFGIAYRYRRSVIEQGDLSLVWPVARRWRLVGRYSYSFLESEPLEQFVGWEYDACCWRLSVVGRRFVSRRTGESDSSISVQIQLKGFSQRVSSPEELLDRGTLGYRSTGTNPP